MKNKALMKRIGNVALSVLLVVLVVFFAIAVYSRVTGKQVLPYTTLWVLSPSMEDTIPQYSFILVKRVDAADVAIGDVITFHSHDPAILGQLNTHRVMDITPDGKTFITKGDNNVVADAYPVSDTDIVARFVRVMPVLTFVGRLYSSKTGFIAVIAVIFVGAFLWFNRYLRKSTAKSDEDEAKARDEEIDRLVAEEVARLEREAKEKDNK